MKKHEQRGKRPPNTKLNEDIVRALRADKAAGLTQRQRSAKYGIPIGTINSIDSGLNWGWVR